jgi:hypothetical protein
MTHYEALYVSDMSPETSTSDVAKILVQARTNNRNRGVAGLLLFDGARFVHLLSGPHAAVTQLLQTISRDARHQHISILCEGFVATPTVCDFNFGYWYVDDETYSALELKKYTGRAAVKALLDRKNEFDL